MLLDISVFGFDWHLAAVAVPALTAWFILCWRADVPPLPSAAPQHPLWEWVLAPVEVKRRPAIIAGQFSYLDPPAKVLALELERWETASRPSSCRALAA